MRTTENMTDIQIDDLYLDALARGARIEDLPSVFHADPLTIILIAERDAWRQ